MTHYIKHQYDELLPPIMPGLEIHVVYNCESEITFGDDGEEESNRLVSIEPVVNNHTTHFEKFPEEKDGADARKFLAILRDSARKALWAKAMRRADAFPITEQHIVAYRWQTTGSTKLTLAKPGETLDRPEQPFVI